MKGFEAKKHVDSSPSGMMARYVHANYAKGGFVNRRRYERVPFFCTVQLTIAAVNLSVEAHTCDISLGGVKLAAPLAVKVGTSVEMAFALCDDAGKRIVEPVTGRVARCEADIDASYLGIEFSAPLNEADNPHLTRKLMSL